MKSRRAMVWGYQSPDRRTFPAVHSRVHDKHERYRAARSVTSRLVEVTAQDKPRVTDAGNVESPGSSPVEDAQKRTQRRPSKAAHPGSGQPSCSWRGLMCNSQTRGACRARCARGLVDRLVVVERYSGFGVLQQVAGDLREQASHFGEGGVEELAPRVHAVHALVSQPAVHLGFDTDCVVGEGDGVDAVWVMKATVLRVLTRPAGGTGPICGRVGRYRAALP